MIKVDIISGFLGSGKTTLIKLLANALIENDERVVIIENEFGEIGIDGKTLELEGLEVFEITKGCLCCSVKGDFVEILLKIVREINPDRILIEPSGIFIPIDIIDIFKDPKISCNMELNSLITIIDCVHYLKQRVKYSFFFENQIKYAESVVMSKMDNISFESISIIRREILKINPALNLTMKPWLELTNEEFLKLMSKQIPESALPETASVMPSSIVSVPPQPPSIVAASLQQPSILSTLPEPITVSPFSAISTFEAKSKPRKNQLEGYASRTIPNEQKGHKNFQTFSLTPHRNFTKDSLHELLSTLRNPIYGCILRIKGFVLNETNIIEFNVVDQSIDIKFIDDKQVKPSICFIGENLKKQELEKLFL